MCSNWCNLAAELLRLGEALVGALDIAGLCHADRISDSAVTPTR